MTLPRYPNYENNGVYSRGIWPTFHSTPAGAIKPRQPVNFDVGAVEKSLLKIMPKISSKLTLTIALRSTISIAGGVEAR